MAAEIASHWTGHGTIMRKCPPICCSGKRRCGDAGPPFPPACLRRELNFRFCFPDRGYGGQPAGTYTFPPPSPSARRSIPCVVRRRNRFRLIVLARKFLRFLQVLLLRVTDRHLLIEDFLFELRVIAFIRLFHASAAGIVELVHDNFRLLEPCPCNSESPRGTGCAGSSAGGNRTELPSKRSLPLFHTGQGGAGARRRDTHLPVNDCLPWTP